MTKTIFKEEFVLKKVLVIALLLLLVFGTATYALGATVYLDSTVGGESKIVGETEDASLTNFTVAVPLDQWKIEFSAYHGSGDSLLSYGPITVKPKLDGYSLKAGYALVKTAKFQLDLTAGLRQEDVKIVDIAEIGLLTGDIDTAVFGLEAAYQFTGKAAFNLTVDYGPSAEYKTGIFSIDAENYLTYQARFQYEVVKNLSLTAGYYNHSFDLGPNWIPSDLKKVSFSGATLGLAYKF
jgi:opacity protein-like surface antigen